MPRSSYPNWTWFKTELVWVVVLEEIAQLPHPTITQNGNRVWPVFLLNNQIGKWVTLVTKQTLKEGTITDLDMSIAFTSILRKASSGFAIEKFYLSRLVLIPPVTVSKGFFLNLLDCSIIWYNHMAFTTIGTGHRCKTNSNSGALQHFLQLASGDCSPILLLLACPIPKLTTSTRTAVYSAYDDYMSKGLIADKHKKFENSSARSAESKNHWKK